MKKFSKKYMREIASRGGKKTFRKYGKKYFAALANASNKVQGKSYIDLNEPSEV